VVRTAIKNRGKKTGVYTKKHEIMHIAETPNFKLFKSKSGRGKIRAILYLTFPFIGRLAQ